VGWADSNIRVSLAQGRSCPLASQLETQFEAIRVAVVAQRYSSLDHFFVVRWGVPDQGDFASIGGEVERLHRRAGCPLIYVAIMPADLPNLDESARKGLLELTERVLPLCETLVIVIEARGFKGAIARSAMTAITLLTRRHDKLRIVDSIDAAIELVRAELPGDHARLRAAIVSTGTSAPVSLSA